MSAVSQGNITVFYCVVGHIYRFFPKSFEARLARQRGFNQTTSVSVFCRQHIYVNGTVQFLPTQHIKDGAGRLKKEFQDQDGFLNLGYKPPAAHIVNLSLGVLLDLYGSCSSINPKIDVITLFLKHLKRAYSVQSTELVLLAKQNFLGQNSVKELIKYTEHKTTETFYSLIFKYFYKSK